MKALQYISVLFILTLLVGNNAMAQKASYTSSGGLTFGFGVSESYQRSDLANSDGLAFDLIFGSQLYQKENAFLAVDWKFRFLAGENKAYDHRINPDNSFSNILYKFNNYDLELGLTLNRLRERTRIVLSGFAGAGITHGRTFTDLYDAGNNLYDYSAIDPNRDSELVYKELVSLSDGEFETTLINKAAFLPTAGLYIGYQVSRSFALGIEFKTNFYLTEQNSFSGIDLDNRILTGSGLDRNSLVSLGLRWNPGRGSSPGRAISPIDPTPVSRSPLAVNITDPSGDTYNTESYNYTLRARVDNVGGSDNITFYQNGFPNNRFTYNVSTNMFTAPVQLRDGENSFRIRAAYQGSTAEDRVIITHDNPPVQPKPQQERLPAYTPRTVAQVNKPAEITPPPAENAAVPSVRFINPAFPLNVRDSRFSLRAEARNVRGRNDVTVKLNGTGIGNFTFNTSGSISVILNLSEGINTIEITARNSSGIKTERTRITYQRAAAETNTITYQEPETGTTILTHQEPKAESNIITYQEPVVVRTNIRDKEPDPERRTDRRTNITTSESDPPRPCPSPDITLPDAVQGKISTSQRNYTMRAGVRNISNRNQLRATLNGNSVPFSFSNNILTCKIPLVSGTNTFFLKAKNECGEENASARITYTPPVAPGVEAEEPVIPVIPAEQAEPCAPPTVSVSLTEVNRADATHELRGFAYGVKNKSEIKLTVDGRTNNGFQFIPSKGALSAKYKLTPGTHTVVVSVANDCGRASKSVSVTVAPPAEEEKDEGNTDPGDPEEAAEETCGLRINPGNSSWQFCLVTPGRTFTRDNLKNPNFSYSGPATSLYFLPAAGGGKVTVKGNPYPISPGQYYLFTGRLNVTVSTKNPGATGQWSVCVEADRAPVSGNGNKRPKSPCEQESKTGPGGKGKKDNTP